MVTASSSARVLTCLLPDCTVGLGGRSWPWDRAPRLSGLHRPLLQKEGNCRPAPRAVCGPSELSAPGVGDRAWRGLCQCQLLPGLCVDQASSARRVSGTGRGEDSVSVSCSCREPSCHYHRQFQPDLCPPVMGVREPRWSEHRTGWRVPHAWAVALPGPLIPGVAGQGEPHGMKRAASPLLPNPWPREWKPCMYTRAVKTGSHKALSVSIHGSVIHSGGRAATAQMSVSW